MGSWAAATKLNISSPSRSGAAPAGAALPPPLGELAAFSEGCMRDFCSADNRQPAHTFRLLVLDVTSCANTSSGPVRSGIAARPGIYREPNTRKIGGVSTRRE